MLVRSESLQDIQTKSSIYVLESYKNIIWTSIIEYKLWYHILIYSVTLSTTAVKRQVLRFRLLSETLFALGFILNEETDLCFTITYQQSFLFSVPMLCFQNDQRLRKGTLEYMRTENIKIRLRICVLTTRGAGGGGCEWGGARGVITWGWLWYGCTTQNFETYPIHTPGIWKNWPIHILDRPKCWPSHILPFDFISHLLLVVARYRSQFIEYQVNKQPQKIYERKKYTHILGCQKSGAFHIRIKKNGVSHILFVEKKWG